MAKKKQNYIWKDRRRRMGIPLSFTRYALSEDRLFLSVGFFSVKDDELLLYRVRDISTQRSLWQRLFGMGTITITSSDKTHSILVLKNVKHPLMVKELLHSQIEEMKLQRRVRVGEIMGSDLQDDDFEEDDTP